MGRREKYFSPFLAEKGLTLVEVLLAMTINLIVLGATCGMFIFSNKIYNEQEQIARARDNVRGAMRSITRNLIMAGYDPAGVNQDSIPTNNFCGITCNPVQLEIRMDANGDGMIGSGEDIVYQYDSPNERIILTAGGRTIPLAGRIQAFTFAYLDANGNSTMDNSAVRTIRITITGKTEQPDSNYNSNHGYRTFTLISDVSPRNLATN